MELGIAHKTALIVGAGRGLGRQVALRLAREGARVVAVARTALDLESLLSEMGGSGKGHQVIAMDLVPEGAPQNLISQLRASSIEIVVHNIGGTLGLKNPFLSAEQLRTIMRLNLEIAVEINSELVPCMRKRRWGRVVHVSSNAAVLGRGSLAYGVAKAALNAYTHNLGNTVAADGITVSAVMPGAIAYPDSHWDKLAKENPENVKKYLHDRVAARRFASPDEVANFITYLCSEQAALFTGSVVTMDGGGF